MTARQRIVVVSQVPPPIHGSTVMTQVLLDSLERLGCVPELVDRRYSSSLADIGRVSIRKVMAGTGLLWRVLRAVRTRPRPRAVVLFATNRPASFLSDWLISEVLRISRVRVIHYLHTRGFVELASRRGLWASLVGRLLGAADTVVCLGPSLADDVSRWVRPGSIRFIENIPYDPPDPRHLARERTVLFLSNLLPDKGAETFVDLAIALASADVDARVRFVIAGGTADEDFTLRLKQKVTRAGLDDIVRFVGSVDAPAKWDLLQRAGLLVFPTRFDEAQPLTLVEAKHVELPVVATRMGGIPDLWDDTGWLTLVEPGSFDDLVRAVSAQLRSWSSQISVASRSGDTTARYDLAWRAVVERTNHRTRHQDLKPAR